MALEEDDKNKKIGKKRNNKDKKRSCNNNNNNKQQQQQNVRMRKSESNREKEYITILGMQQYFLKYHLEFGTHEIKQMFEEICSQQSGGFTLRLVLMCHLFLFYFRVSFFFL